MSKYEEIVPYENESGISKKEQVATMFDNISGTYDFLNRFLSLGVDVYWRKKLVQQLTADHPRHILDVATGTGDLAFAALKLRPEKIVGIDISKDMLNKAREKMIRRGDPVAVEFVSADSEHIPFESASFDSVMVAFGVRNFTDVEKGLAEMLRVVRPGGKIVILEFSRPRFLLFKILYNFYFKIILPKIGHWISQDKAAYRYLFNSAQAFPEREDFVKVLARAGYKNALCKPLTFGVTSLYVATK